MREVFRWATLAMVSLTAMGAEPKPDFSLKDKSKNSLRYEQMVSPRDYQLQVSGYYFALAGCSYCRSQFGHLQAILNELRAESPVVNLEILGVNEPTPTSDFSIDLMTAGRKMPWLEDTEEARTSEAWGVTIRDVWILDTGNRPVGVLNLTSNDLGLEHNKNTLKSMFRAAIQASDSDGDSLPDDWERKYFGNLAQRRLADPDQDGFSNFAELAFGTNPASADSRPGMEVNFTVSGYFSVKFKRWAGSVADYIVDGAPDVIGWDTNSVELAAPPAVFYDGTGRAEATYTFKRPVTELPSAFFRLRAISR